MKPLILSILILSSCTCPPKKSDGSSGGPCKYVGPAISGNIGFQGVTVGITLWGDTQPHAPTVEIPVNPHDAPFPVTK